MQYEREVYYENSRDFTAGFPFYLVCSANPKRMYPHYHREIELTYFYESNGVEYITKGKNVPPRTRRSYYREPV